MPKKDKELIKDVRKRLKPNNLSAYKFSKIQTTSHTEVPNLQDIQDLQTYLEYSKNLNLKGSSVIRVNTDLHDLLSRLAKKTDVSISELASALLYDFTKKHESEIKKLIKNKFL